MLELRGFMALLVQSAPLESLGREETMVLEGLQDPRDNQGSGGSWGLKGHRETGEPKETKEREGRKATEASLDCKAYLGQLDNLGMLELEEL